MSTSAADRKEAFVQLLGEHRALVVKVARAFGPTKEDRDDLAAEMVAALWRAFPRYDDRLRFSTWMYRVALNVAISYDRAERRSAARRADVDLATIDISVPDDPLDDRIDALFAFIGTLRSIDRAIVVLHLDGYPYADIASMVGLTLTNVATKLNRIKRQASVALARPAEGAPHDHR